MAIIIVSLVLNDRKVVNVEHTNQVLTNRNAMKICYFWNVGQIRVQSAFLLLYVS